MNNVIPIVLFVYRRPIHTKQTVEHLKKNKLASESDLFIFSEYPKTPKFENEVNLVREYIKTITGFKTITIIERTSFLGLANSVISGVNSVLKNYDKVIVLEDDITTSPYFLEYMNEALTKYENEKQIYSITGFCYPSNLLKIYDGYDKDVCLLPRASSWGWGTWKGRWMNVDWEINDFNEFKKNQKLQKKYNETGGDKSRMLIRQMSGEIDSWAIRWDYAHFKANAYCVFPIQSLINNVGLDNSASHTKNLKSHSNILNDFKPQLPNELEIDTKIVEAYKKIYKRGGYTFKIKNSLKHFKEVFFRK